MEEELETATTATSTIATSNGGETTIFHDLHMYSSDIDSTCSTPYVSAPSSPGRVGGGGGGFFYSAPASPMHYVLCSSSPNPTPPPSDVSAVSASFEFDFSARFGNIGSSSAGSMISADELFLNGQIRPMKLSTHLQRPQVLAPLLDLDETEIDCENDVTEGGEKCARGRDVKWRDRSLRRRTRSMSPLRSSSSFQWHESDDDEGGKKREDNEMPSIEIKPNEEAVESSETTPSMSASSSRSSSVSRSSKRWVFLKEFLYRSKSEGRNDGHKFWSSISFSPGKERKVPTPPPAESIGNVVEEKKKKAKQSGKEPKKSAASTGAGGGGKPTNGVGKRRGAPPSPHELHYKANRAQAEEMRKKTFLPYRQGLLGCLGFSSKSYGAMNGFARALNPVSSR